MTDAPFPRWVELEGSANVRDLGGLPTLDGRRTRAGVLIRSANLQHLTGADLQRLVVDLGVRRVVDLRTDVEVSAEGPGPMTTEAGVTIHHLSLFPDSTAVADDVETVDVHTGPGGEAGAGEAAEYDPDRDSLLLPWHNKGSATITGDPGADRYLSYLDGRPDSVVAALRAIAEPDGATVVHCAAGKDRTGVVVALALTLAGVERPAIVADYAATEQQIAAIVALLGRTGTYKREVTDPGAVPPPRPEVMARVLEALDERPGGLAGWLASHGWTEDDTVRLRATLVDDA